MKVQFIKIITKVSLITFCILIMGNLSAQQFQRNFLGDNFMLYKNALLKINDRTAPGAFNSAFYSDLSYCQELYDKNVIYPEKRSPNETSKDSLINRVFLVKDIIDKYGNPYRGSSSINHPIFELEDTTSNQIIYYIYSERYEYNFPFIVYNVATDFDLDYICSLIEKKTDDFTNEIKLNSPLTVNTEVAPLIIYKTIKNNQVIYNLALQTYGVTFNSNQSGVIILFDDGTKMNKPSTKVNVDYSNSGYEYRSFIFLTENDMKILSTKRIKKFRLYIYDKEIEPMYSNKFTKLVKCIMDSK
ncbi:MAG TPA: hypothetical protein VKZ44_01935 [Taishania sp.]|nr:hypothetical protein [Taishania sp.]